MATNKEHTLRKLQVCGWLSLCWTTRITQENTLTLGDGLSSGGVGVLMAASWGAVVRVSGSYIAVVANGRGHMLAWGIFSEPSLSTRRAQ